jgi:hypothetical protein
MIEQLQTRVVPELTGNMTHVENRERKHRNYSREEFGTYTLQGRPSEVLLVSLFHLVVSQTKCL